MTFENDLRALRAGELDFNRFARIHDKRFERWAQFFLNRYPQTVLGVDDLKQEAFFEAWRAVDRWEPEGASLVRFVEYRVGSAIRNALERVVGWKRGVDRRVTVPLETLRGHRGPVTENRGPLLVEVSEALQKLPRGLERDVLAGIGLGIDLKIVATHLYADSVRRLEYRFDSQSDAIRKVRGIVKGAVKKTEMRGKLCHY